MSIILCPSGHRLDTDIIGEEGTFECDKCTIAYLQGRLDLLKPPASVTALVHEMQELGILCSAEEFKKNNCASCQILHERLPWLAPYFAETRQPAEQEESGS